MPPIPLDPSPDPSSQGIPKPPIVPREYRATIPPKGRKSLSAPSEPIGESAKSVLIGVSA